MKDFRLYFHPFRCYFFSKCMIKDQKQILYFKILFYHAFTLLCIDVLSCFTEFWSLININTILQSNFVETIFLELKLGKEYGNNMFRTMTKHVDYLGHYSSFIVHHLSLGKF